jgi:hypothetical protein
VSATGIAGVSEGFPIRVCCARQTTCHPQLNTYYPPVSPQLWVGAGVNRDPSVKFA